MIVPFVVLLYVLCRSIAYLKIHTYDLWMDFCRCTVCAYPVLFLDPFSLLYLKMGLEIISVRSMYSNSCIRNATTWIFINYHFTMIAAKVINFEWVWLYINGLFMLVCISMSLNRQKRQTLVCREPKKARSLQNDVLFHFMKERACTSTISIIIYLST